jgi:hypothetical protein
MAATAGCQVRASSEQVLEVDVKLDDLVALDLDDDRVVGDDCRRPRPVVLPAVGLRRDGEEPTLLDCPVPAVLVKVPGRVACEQAGFRARLLAVVEPRVAGSVQVLEPDVRDDPLAIQKLPGWWTVNQLAPLVG